MKNITDETRIFMFHQFLHVSTSTQTRKLHIPHGTDVFLPRGHLSAIMHIGDAAGVAGVNGGQWESERHGGLQWDSVRCNGLLSTWRFHKN